MLVLGWTGVGLSSASVTSAHRMLNEDGRKNLPLDDVVPFVCFLSAAEMLLVFMRYCSI